MGPSNTGSSSARGKDGKRVRSESISEPEVVPRKGKQSKHRTEKARELDAQQSKKRKKGHQCSGSGSEVENGQGKAASDKEGRSSDAEDGGSSRADSHNKNSKGGGAAESPIEIISDSEEEITPGQKTCMKADMTRDLLTVFSNRVTVKFVSSKGHSTEEEGRWYEVCRVSKRIQKQKGSRAGWYKGANSTLCHHIASAHYEEYSKRCREQNVEENWRCVPKEVVEQRKAAERKEGESKGERQTTLDGVVRKVQMPTAFSPKGILKETTELIVCGAHALSLADDIHFHNCLVTMRPKTKHSELPTCAAVRTTINNSFIDFLADLNAEISSVPGDVSCGWDTWTAPHTSDAYLGLLVHCIKIDPRTGVWSFRDEVAACHKVVGKHTGANLGKYLLLFLDRCGVPSKTETKLGHITNDSASNNGTAAEQVEYRLERRGIRGDWKASERRFIRKMSHEPTAPGQAPQATQVSQVSDLVVQAASGSHQSTCLAHPEPLAYRAAVIFH
ncbi:hypothetical protein C8Q80DRAFT_1121282 [Daedaleopsis nitida]|nr:hypothetical protein C8Q80DRAFT_1121282 [Daedaleopsis nitida]